MVQAAYPKIKNALTRLAYLLSQTTRSELAVIAVDALRYYEKDDAEFLNKSLSVLEQICNHKNILPKPTYFLALAALEQVKLKLK